MDLIQTGWSPLYNRHVDGLWTLDEKASSWDDCVLAALGRGEGKAIDDSETAAVGALSGAYSLPIKDLRCTGWFFDSSNDHINFGSNSAWDFADELCVISGWFCKTDTDTAFLFDRGSTAGWGCYATGGSPQTLRFAHDSSYVEFSAALPIGTNTNLAFVADGTNLALYVDGVLHGSEAIRAGGFGGSSGRNLYIGSSNTGSFPYGGTIANFMLWNSHRLDVLSAISSRDPSLKGSIRSTIPQFIPATSGGAPPSSYTTQQFIWIGV